VHQGLADETQDGYPVLLLNQQSWEVLRGERRVQMAIRSRPPRKQKTQKARPVEGADEALFQKLRAHRKQLADQAGVPPYIIFHDATLRAIAQRLPRAAAHFATIPGVGQSKLDRFAESFMCVIREHLENSDQRIADGG
jgi:ATP-dependent DNA helicase RecQ